MSFNYGLHSLRQNMVIWQVWFNYTTRKWHKWQIQFNYLFFLNLNTLHEWLFSLCYYWILGGCSTSGFLMMYWQHVFCLYFFFTLFFSIDSVWFNMGFVKLMSYSWTTNITASSIATCKWLVCLLHLHLLNHYKIFH